MNLYKGTGLVSLVWGHSEVMYCFIINALTLLDIMFSFLDDWIFKDDVVHLHFYYKDSCTLPHL